MIVVISLVLTAIRLQRSARFPARLVGAKPDRKLDKECAKGRLSGEGYNVARTKLICGDHYQEESLCRSGVDFSKRNCGNSVSLTIVHTSEAMEHSFARC